MKKSKGATHVLHAGASDNSKCLKMMGEQHAAICATHLKHPKTPMRSRTVICIQPTSSTPAPPFSKKNLTAVCLPLRRGVEEEEVAVLDLDARHHSSVVHGCLDEGAVGGRLAVGRRRRVVVETPSIEKSARRLHFRRRRSPLKSFCGQRGKHSQHTCR